jgi:hypothetical protein
MSEKGVKIGIDDGLGASFLLRDLSRAGRPFGSATVAGGGVGGGNLGARAISGSDETCLLAFAGGPEGSGTLVDGSLRLARCTGGGALVGLGGGGGTG